MMRRFWAEALEVRWLALALLLVLVAESAAAWLFVTWLVTR